MRSRRRPLAALSLVIFLALALCAGARADTLVYAGHWPISDTRAAAAVSRSAWEPRAGNAAANHTMPTRAQLNVFYNQSQMPYARYVTGHYTGSTDEIIQWAAHKWGFSPNLFRAVAAVESWWQMSFTGDGGTSFGLFQVRSPYHCGGQVCAWFAHDTAFNADYYGATLRSYYDGAEGWLNTVSGNGERYRAHDLWDSVGYWCAGRWHVQAGFDYVAKVQSDLSAQVWLGRWF